MSAQVEPSIRETAFSCPHCSAFTTQYWYKFRADPISGEQPTPSIPNEEFKKRFLSNRDMPDEAKRDILATIDKMLTGFVFFEETKGIYLGLSVRNLHVSKCYNCNKIAVWVHDRLLFPSKKVGVLPNVDLPEDILHDFEEAREIVDASPRGAAALLRLCIQKLCSFLGEKGKNIDEDIGCLVKKGLNPLVQQSLDIVRVIGNEAVHPGVIDLRDHRDTALRLFELVNAITDQMISHPKSVRSMYEKLPETKRKAIEARDKTKIE